MGVSLERPGAVAGRFAFLLSDKARVDGMNLSSIANPASDTIRGVRFAMLYGPTLVPVLVTHAALENMAPAMSNSGDHLSCFNKHRDVFEQVASTKHARGQLTVGGAVIVDVADLKTASSS